MKEKKKDNSGLVYSTEHGRMCPACGQPSAACLCRSSRTSAPGNGIVRISRESKGRKGKGVTLISGLGLAADSLNTLAGELKRKCGSGGTVKNGIIEIQGDHRDTLFAELTRQGYLVKYSGG